MTLPDLNFRTPAPTITVSQIAANVAALGYPDGWTAADDIALVEGLFMGLKLAQIGIPRGKTIVCRCEEVSAKRIREAAGIGIAAPNQVKSFTRCGMGPCQGRECGYTVSAILADVTGKPMEP